MPSSPSDTDRSRHSAGLLLRVHRPDGRSDEFYLAGGLTIGRSLANSVVLADDASVDRAHARVEVADDGAACLRCLEPDGSLLVGDALVPELALDAGVRFRVGRTEFECLSGQRRADHPGEPLRSTCPFCASAESVTAGEGIRPCAACTGLILPVWSDPHAPGPLLLPAVYGDYQAERYVARGGMGLVLKGVHANGTQPVAIKVLLPGTLADQSEAESFEREVAMLARVRHPNVVALLDHGKAGRFPFLALEWIEGPSLRQVIAEANRAGKPTDFAESFRWFGQVAKGLAAIHAVGIVHRDLKPSNILIGSDGVAQVADLGIAKRVDAGQTAYTATGHAPGTFAYMAPEQWNAPGSVDGRSDLYALGTTFYEVLTGSRPLGAWRAASEINATVPLGFNEILSRLLAPRPQDRYDDIHDLLGAFSAFGRIRGGESNIPLRDEQPVRPQSNHPQAETAASTQAHVVPDHGDDDASHWHVEPVIPVTHAGEADPAISLPGEVRSTVGESPIADVDRRNLVGQIPSGGRTRSLREHYEAIRDAYARAERGANSVAWSWAGRGARWFGLLGVAIGGPIGCIVAIASGDWGILGIAFVLIALIILLGFVLGGFAGAFWGAFVSLCGPKPRANLKSISGPLPIEPRPSRDDDGGEQPCEAIPVPVALVRDGQKSIPGGHETRGKMVYRYLVWVGKLGVEIASSILNSFPPIRLFSSSEKLRPLHVRMKDIPGRPDQRLLRSLGYVGALVLGLSLSIAALVLLSFLVAKSGLTNHSAQDRQNRQVSEILARSPGIKPAGGFPLETPTFTPHLDSDASKLEQNARIMIRRGNYDGAIAACNALIQRGEMLPQAYGQRGVARALKRDFPGALADGNQAVQLGPESAAAFACRGQVYNEMRDSTAALADCERAIELDPRFSMAYVCRCLIRLAHGQNEAALIDSEQAIALAPDLPEAFLARGIVRLARSLPDEALADCDEAIRRDPTSADAYEVRALIHLIREEVDKALADASKLIELQPANSNGWYYRGAALNRQRKYAPAIVDLNRALELDPNHALAHNERGLVFQAQGHVEQALSSFDAAIRLDTKFANAFSNRALAHLGRNNADGALADVNRAIELDPVNAESRSIRGLVHNARRNDDQAILDFDEAIRLNATLAPAYNGRGVASFNKGELDRAINNFDNAIRLDPSDPEEFANRGITHQAKREFDLAVADFRSALRLNPPDSQKYQDLLHAVESAIRADGR